MAVRRRIQEAFDNGRHYYELEGKPIAAQEDVSRRRDPLVFRWHTEHVFAGVTARCMMILMTV